MDEQSLYARRPVARVSFPRRVNYDSGNRRSMRVSQGKKLAILVGGGPAPGINSVIGAATIRGRLENVEVLGIRDGFQWLMHGNIDHVVPLTIHEVSRIHFRGGSQLGTARANPTVDPKL